MLFLRLFLIFLKIGIFTFGGGYAMVSLIENEVVEKQQWLTTEEFTDILAVSQTTPGPIGINTATYVGYTAALDAGYGTAGAVAGALLASFAVILLPVALLLIVARFLFRHRENLDMQNIFRALRITVLGLIAAAALSLLGEETFGTPGLNKRFVVSCAIFAAVFILSILPRKKHSVKETSHSNFQLSNLNSPIVLMIAAALLGLLFYA